MGGGGRASADDPGWCGVGHGQLHPGTPSTWWGRWQFACRVGGLGFVTPSSPFHLVGSSRRAADSQATGAAVEEGR